MKAAFHILVGLLLLAGTPVLPAPGSLWPMPATQPELKPQPVAATAAVYVYEKDAGPVPAGVTSGIDRLNRERKIVASLFEDDSTDGVGHVPEQYRPALAAARKSGEPVLVVLSGTAVVRTAKVATVDDVLGAVP